jgi:hypothetical protein
LKKRLCHIQSNTCGLIKKPKIRKEKYEKKKEKIQERIRIFKKKDGSREDGEKGPISYF